MLFKEPLALGLGQISKPILTIDSKTNPQRRKPENDSSITNRVIRALTNTLPISNDISMMLSSLTLTKGSNSSKIASIEIFSNEFILKTLFPPLMLNGRINSSNLDVFKNVSNLNSVHIQDSHPTPPLAFPIPSSPISIPLLRQKDPVME